MFYIQNCKYFKQRMTVSSWISFESACIRTAWCSFYLLRAGNASLEGSGRICSLLKQMYIRGVQTKVCHEGHVWSGLKFIQPALDFFLDPIYLADTRLNQSKGFFCLHMFLRLKMMWNLGRRVFGLHFFTGLIYTSASGLGAICRPARRLCEVSFVSSSWNSVHTCDICCGWWLASRRDRTRVK